jgi:hypothetical protein
MPSRITVTKRFAVERKLLIRGQQVTHKAADTALKHLPDSFWNFFITDSIARESRC